MDRAISFHDFVKLHGNYLNAVFVQEVPGETSLPLPAGITIRPWLTATKLMPKVSLASRREGHSISLKPFFFRASHTSYAPAPDGLPQPRGCKVQVAVNVRMAIGDLHMQDLCHTHAAQLVFHHLVSFALRRTPEARTTVLRSIHMHIAPSNVALPVMVRTIGTPNI